MRIGIHTHGDGFIHTHPFTSSEGGTNATFGRFLSYGGWSASEDSLSLWEGPAAAPGRTDFSNGDKCPPGTLYAGQAAVVKYSVNCKNQFRNPSDVRLADGEVIAIGFVPKSYSLGVPPNATDTRITSYNVCYTKLLRNSVALSFFLTMNIKRFSGRLKFFRLVTAQ